MPIQKVYALELDLSEVMMPIFMEYDDPEWLNDLRRKEAIREEFLGKCLAVSNYYGESQDIGVRSYRIDNLLFNNRPASYNHDQVILYSATITVRKFRSKRELNVAKLTNERLFMGTQLRTHYEQVPKDKQQ